MIIVYGILCLSLVVFVHELGHFAAARLCGIEVLRFSLGMGKRLFGFSYRGTDYCVSLLPIGGYCKMKGEDALLQAFGQSGNIVKEKGSFFAAHPLKRVLVSVMGPFFNVVFAACALSIVAFIGYTTETSPSRILLASEYPDFAAADARSLPYPADFSGLKSGDIVLSIDGSPIENYSQIQDIVFQNPDKKLQFEVERGGQRLSLRIVPFLDKENAIGRIGVYSWSEAVIDEVRKGSPAFTAGLLPGDRVKAVDGMPIRAAIDIEYALRTKPSSLALKVERSGREIDLELKPEYSSKGNKSAIDTGFTTERTVYAIPGLGFFLGLAKGVSETGKKIVLTIKGISLLFKKINLSKAIAGPVRITYMMGSVAESAFNVGIGIGIVSVLDLLSVISIGLFLTNLLPLPILDGGQIVLFIIETFRRKTLKPETIFRINMVGLVLLFGIFLFTTFNDILFFTKG